MEKLTQLEIVRQRLLETGEVSRNWCLREKFITRLGSRIYDLRKEGFEFEAKNRKVGNRNDYVYIVKKVGQLKLI